MPETPAEWDEMYAASEEVWSGDPNGVLVTETVDLTPGRALDVGCGEGADAVWLASRGWDVTALDVSRVALSRAKQRAAAAGAAVTWLCSDLLGADLAPGSFDLVSAQYGAFRRTADDSAERALLEAVAPGGTLLVVHHDMSDPEHLPHDMDPDEWVGPRDVRRLLDAGWTDVALDVRERNLTRGAGAHHSRDVILRARRER